MLVAKEKKTPHDFKKIDLPQFLGIKNVMRDDILGAHRMMRQLLGVVPRA